MGWATAQLCHNTMGNCIVTQQVLGGLNGLWVYCNTPLYRDMVALGVQWLELYCNTPRCIMTEAARVSEKIVLQYTLVYCDRSGSWLGKAVSRYKKLYRD